MAKSVKDYKCKADFIHGGAYLDSKTKRLKSLGCYINDKCQYKSDGLIKLYGTKKLEILLFETSGSFNYTDNVKINFDHHKGTFGSLALLKCIADEFFFASVEKFKKVKVFFVHAAGNIHFLDTVTNVDFSFLVSNLYRKSNPALEHSF